MATTEENPRADTAHDEVEPHVAHPTPDTTDVIPYQNSASTTDDTIEAYLALAEASLTIYKPLVNALRPETSSFVKILKRIRGKNTGLANSLRLNHKMIDAMADSHPMLKINSLCGSGAKGQALAEQTREVYALITLLLGTMKPEDAKQLKGMLADVLAETNTWEDANRVVDNKCRDDSQGLPGLYRLVGRLCQGAGLEERQIAVYQYVKVAAVTAVAILLTKPTRSPEPVPAPPVPAPPVVPPAGPGTAQQQVSRSLVDQLVGWHHEMTDNLDSIIRLLRERSLLLNIDCIKGTSHEGNVLQAKVREVYAAVPAMIASLGGEDREQLRNLVADITEAIETNSSRSSSNASTPWAAANTYVFNQRNSNLV